MDNKMLELPDSWAAVKLGDFVENEKGKKPKNESRTETASHPIPYVDIQAFEENVIRTWTDGVGCRLCYETDFLMVWDGSRSGLVGKGMNGALGSTLVRIYFPSMVNDFAFYFLQSKYQQINTRAKGVGIPHVDPALLWNYDFPIPPLNEQHRIVAKIEELFSELDKGIENLKTARAQLKVYRQALLKHAFEGKLTAQWREQNQDKLETADALLKRIQQERAQRYKQQLAEWEAAGKQGSKPKAPKPLPPLTAEELAELPELPEGWGWAKIGVVTDCLDSLRVPINKTERLNRQGDVPYYGANGQVGWIDDYLFDEPLILVVEDETFTGREKPFSYKITGKAWVNNHAHILKPVLGVDIDYLNYQLFFYPFTAITTGTTGRKKLTQDAMINAPIKICPHQEQMAIAERLDANLSEIDQLDLTITTSLQQAEALRQSILKKAFSGQLVPQDPHDEPASTLLARIKAGKAKSPQPPFAKGGRSRSGWKITDTEGGSI